MTFGDGLTTPVGLVCTKGFPVLSTLPVRLTGTPRSDCTRDYKDNCLLFNNTKKL